MPTGSTFDGSMPTGSTFDGSMPTGSTFDGSMPTGSTFDGFTGSTGSAGPSTTQSLGSLSDAVNQQRKKQTQPLQRSRLLTPPLKLPAAPPQHLTTLTLPASLLAGVSSARQTPPLLPTRCQTP